MTKPAWNKNKSVGQKKPLTDEDITLLKRQLNSQGRLKELALFSLQIDTMLRSSDVIRLKVEDVVDFTGKVKSAINIKQKKTRKSHIAEISPSTVRILADYIKGKELNDWLFSGYRGKHLSRYGHAYLWKNWIKILGLDPKEYATHSGRRTMAVKVWNETKDPNLVRQLLGQNDLASTTHYLGLTTQGARDIYRERFLK